LKPIVWRDYEPEDEAAVRTLQFAMEERVGRKMDLPDLDREPVVVTQVGLTDGVITHCLYAEAELELCAAGIAPLSAEQMEPAVKRMREVADLYKIRIVRCYVPEVMLTKSKRGRDSAIERMLKKLGFTRENESMRQFFRWLV